MEIWLWYLHIYDKKQNIAAENNYMQTHSVHTCQKNTSTISIFLVSV